MANPQPDYFVRISQELFDALNRADLGSTERPVLDCVIGETYGKNRKAAPLSWADVARSVGKERRNTQRAGEALIGRRFLVLDFDPEGRQLLGPQKDFDKWLPRKPTGSGIGSRSGSRSGSFGAGHHDPVNGSPRPAPFLMSKNRSNGNDKRQQPDAFGFTHDPTAARAYPTPDAAALAGVNPETHARWARLSDDERDSVADLYLDHWRPLFELPAAQHTDAALAHLVAQLLSAAGGMPSYLSPEIGVHLAGALDRLREEQEQRDEKRRRTDREEQAKE